MFLFHSLLGIPVFSISLNSKLSRVFRDFFKRDISVSANVFSVFGNFLIFNGGRKWGVRGGRGRKLEEGGDMVGEGGEREEGRGEGEGREGIQGILIHHKIFKN